MRFSIIGLLGTGLVGVAVGCGSDAVDGDSASAGAAGKAHAGTGGKGSASKGGSTSKGGSGGSKAGSAGTTTTGGTHARGGTGATSGADMGGMDATGESGASVGGSGHVGGTGGKAGKGGKGGTAGNGGTAGTGATAGTGGIVIVEAGAGGQAGEGGTGDSEPGAGGVDPGASGAGSLGLAGADAVGNGGEPNAAGAPGSPSCAGVECGDACIDPLARTLDQTQLDHNGLIYLTPTQLPGQSFTVGTAGMLTGIEVAIGPSNGADASGSVDLELLDSAGTSLGHVALAQSGLPEMAGDDVHLSEQTVGAGYFDLTPLCINAQVGDVFTFMFSLVGNPTAICDPDSNQCTNSGDFCMDDFECQATYVLDFTNCGGVGCAGSPSDYTGGNLFARVYGDFQAYAVFDLTFKTFVQ